MRTGRITAAKVAFYYHIMLFVQNGATKRAGRYTGHTFYTNVLVELDCAGVGIATQSIHETRLNTSSIVALKTYHRNPQVFETAIQRINSRLSPQTINSMRKRTGQFAGAAAGTEIRRDYETIFHD